MKLKPFKLLLQALVLCSMLFLNFQGSTSVYAAGNAPKQSIIKSDGTLDLGTGYNGNLDIKNYSVVLDPMRGPILKPLTAVSAWTPMGTPLTAEVRAIAISGSDVYIGGDFGDIGGNANMAHIAKWNGTNWSAMDSGLNGSVLAIGISGTDVYAGGSFAELSGNKDYIAKWNGTIWVALGTIPLDNAVWTIATKGTDVYVGGAFINAGGNPNADHIAKWNGTAWSAMGAAAINNAVNIIVANPANNDVYAGGSFTDAGGDVNADRIAKWNGTTWSALGVGLNNTVLGIAINGTNIFAGGLFLNAGGVPAADYFAKWNGTSWSAMGPTLNGFVSTVALSSGILYIGGGFTDAGGNLNADRIAKWNGTGWSHLGTGLNDEVSVITLKGTDVYVGGIFTDAGANTGADYIAKFVPDFTAPKVISSLRMDTNPTGKNYVRFKVTFSEPVTGVDKTDFTLTITGLAGASLYSITGTGATRIVTVKTGTKNGTVRLNILDNNSIIDAALNPLNGAYGGGHAYNVIKIRTINSTGSQDGWVLESSETSNLGSTLNATGTTYNLGDNAVKKQYRGILSFSTGGVMPDNAVITSVVLKIKRNAIVGGGNPLTIFQGFMIDIKNGFFSTLPGLQTTDFQAVPSKSYGPVTAPTFVADWYGISLTIGKDYINKLSTNGGLTQIRLRFKLDDNNNALANYMSFYSGDAPLASRPQLIITYYVP